MAINIHSCVNAATQYAGIAALTGPQDAVDTMMAAFAERRRYITDRLNTLPGVSCIEPLGAFYAFPNITGTGMTAREFQNQVLADAHVATIAGTSFGDMGEGFIRFSYAASLEAITEALDRVEAFLKAR